MSLKLAVLKALGSATLVGIGAVAASSGSGSRRRNKGGNCTPCKLAAMNDRAKQVVKTGRF